MMKPKSNPPRRRATRLRHYNYAQTGGYFVTICAQGQECLFGQIMNGQVQLNKIGEIVVECWNRIPQHFASIELDLSVIMPNHIHGVILLNTVGARSPRPLTHSQQKRRGEVPSPNPTKNMRKGEAPSPDSPTLGQVVAYFKYQSTKYINQYRDMPGTRVWQRNYYDHVLRNDIDLQRIRQYITDNPMQWELDQLHPCNLSKS